MIRSESGAQFAMEAYSQQWGARVGRNFSKPAPVREVSRPAVRLGYVLTLACAVIGAAVIIL